MHASRKDSKRATVQDECNDTGKYKGNAMNVVMFLWKVSRAVHFAAEGHDSPASAGSRSKEYNREKQRLILIGMIASTLSGALLVFSGLPKRISDEVDSVATNKWARRSIFAILIAAFDAMMSLPLSYVSGFTVEHRYGLSNQTRRGWAFEHLKGLVIALPFSAVGANVILEIIERWPKRWWAVVTALALPFTVLLTQLSPVLLMPIFNRFEPLKDQDLAARLKKLAAQSGISVASVLQMDMSRQTNKANAFFAGMGRTRRIVLADTMIDSFSPEEIEVIVAHEIAHQANRDLWRFVATGTLLTAGLSWTVDILARNIVRQYGAKIRVRSLSQPAALPLLGWLLSLVALSVTPFQNIYSRRIERRADTYALELTRNPSAFESAMQRLGEMNLADPNPPAVVKYTLYSHPPISERIERARRFAKEGM